jgi:hypothetical protein
MAENAMTSEEPAQTPPSIEVFSEDDRWALVQRIVSSRPFARAPRLREFLLFVTNRALTARLSEINELEIGRTALGRRAAFNPQEDNIVRVQARHLRAKLDEYFRTEGRDEPLIVTLPKGTYVPSFEPCPSQPSASLSDVRQAQPSSWSFGRKHLLGLVLIAAQVGLGLTIWKITLYRSDRSRNVVSLSRNPLLSRVLGTGDSIKVVVGDVGLAFLEHSLARILSLEEYLRDDYPHYLLSSVSNKGLQATLESASARPYTSYSDVNAVTMLMQFGQQYQTKFFVRHPRQLNIRDFETSSFILLGGPISNPWYQLLEPRLNFVFEANIKEGKVWIRNKAPRPGEEQTYLPVVRPNAEETFAVIGVLPNLSCSGQLLLLAGVRMEGVEAATNMILHDELPSDLLRIVRQARGQDDSIEILLSTRTVAGLPQDTKIVAYRVHPAAGNTSVKTSSAGE